MRRRGGSAHRVLVRIVEEQRASVAPSTLDMTSGIGSLDGRRRGTELP
jgi:hypothetical protein